MRITFLGALTLLFIALKLTNVIAWSWWLVLAPIWIGPVIVLLFFFRPSCSFYFSTIKRISLASSYMM